MSSPQASNSYKLLKLKGFKILNKIGSGSFSTVFKALTDNEEHKEVAIKCIDKTKVSDKMFDNIVNEIKVLKLLHHEHIVSMLDFLWDERYVYIILECCNGGDLSTFIRKKERLSEHVCQHFVHQLVLALKFLRENNICHLDLKPQNILISNNSIKLADFGFAQILTPDARQCSMRGSPLYMAPEILAGNEYDSKADLWSLGIIVFECLFGHAPYSNCSFKELKIQAHTPNPIIIPDTHLSYDCHDFLTKLLQKNPKHRIDHEAVFKHPFPNLKYDPHLNSYDKGVSLVQRAVQKDSEGQFKDALKLYVEALHYIIPLAHEETDQSKRQDMLRKIEEYKRRVEELRIVCRPPIKETRINNLTAIASSSSQMKAGIEIGELAEMYLAEGKYEVALEKFKSSLNILIPLCEGEPSAAIKNELTKQIKDWLQKAEQIQTILEASRLELSEMSAAAVTSRCVIQ